MGHAEAFPLKLDMMLKASSMSRVAVAQRLGVDKSLIGRWLSGAVHPSEHNLARLSEILAETFPGFRLSDWFETIEGIAGRHGLPAPLSAPDGTAMPVPGVLATFLEAARPEIALRGGAYEGLWRTSRPSLLVRDEIFHDYGMIRCTDDGLVEVIIEGSGLKFAVWLFPIAGNIFVFLFDGIGRTPMSLIFRGVTLPKALSMEGILLLSALDPSRTPAAVPIVIERVGDLCGDRDVDLAHYRELSASSALPESPISPEEIRERLYRDVGPQAVQDGGDLFLSVDASRSLTRGAAEGTLRG